METILFDELSKPFSSEDIEWRIQQCGKKGEKIWAICLAYVTNRAIMDRLDYVVGVGNWRNEYAAGPQGGVLCGLSVRVDGEWVTKWDGADNTDVEAIKGGLSGAMKRAAVQWGIGRYLYRLESSFAIVSDRGRYRQKGKDFSFKWDPPELPSWALPSNEKKSRKAMETAKAPSQDFADMPAESQGKISGLANRAIQSYAAHGIDRGDMEGVYGPAEQWSETDYADMRQWLTNLIRAKKDEKEEKIAMKFRR
jgi:hypothetical protein